MIFSHISRSTYTGSGSGGQSTTKLQSGPLHRGAEDAGKLCRQQREVGRLKRCAQLSNFNADKVQQPIHELEQPQRVAVQHLQILRSRAATGW